MRWYAKSDVAFINGGAIRGTFQNGNITMLDLLQVMPFDAYVYVMKLTGKQLRAALNHGIAGLSEPNANLSPLGQYLQFSSSMRVEWSFQEMTPTIISVAIARRTHSTIADPGVYEPLNEAEVYTVASTSFVAEGGDGYDMFEQIGSFVNELPTPLPLENRLAVGNYIKHANLMSPSEAFLSALSSVRKRMTQLPQTVYLKLGLLCSSRRETCDRMRHTVDLINDKEDGIWDNLLPHSFIEVAEASVDCSKGRAEEALEELTRKFLSTNSSFMMSVVGNICSDDVVALASVQSRAVSEFNGTVISGSSNYGLLADEIEYPQVLRLANSASNSVKALVKLILKFGWKQIAVLHEDTLWGRFAGEELISNFKREVGANAVVLNANETEFNAAAFDSAPEETALQLLTGLHAKGANIICFLSSVANIQRKIFATVYNSKLLYGSGYSALPSLAANAP
jgi:hypothetical protein